MKRTNAVPRPLKAAEYEIFFGNVGAERGWTDLRALARNALADAFDYLTTSATRYDPARCYQLRGDLSTVSVNGLVLPQWQYKITDGARLWYVVEEPEPKTKKHGRVHIMRASSGHPNETDSSKTFR